MSWLTFSAPSVGYMTLVALNIILVMILLVVKSRVDRRAVMGIASLATLCLITTVISHSLVRLGFGFGVLYVRESSTLIQGVCTLRLSGFVFFDLTLPALNIGTSRLMHDLVVATLTVGWFT